MRQIPPGQKTVLLNGVAVGEVMSTGDIEKDAEAVREFLKSKGLHKEISLFQAMLNQAVAFANTSAYLYERDLKRAPRKGNSSAHSLLMRHLASSYILKHLLKSTASHFAGMNC